MALRAGLSFQGKRFHNIWGTALFAGAWIDGGIEEAALQALAAEVLAFVAPLHLGQVLLIHQIARDLPDSAIDVDRIERIIKVMPPALLPQHVGFAIVPALKREATGGATDEHFSGHDIARGLRVKGAWSLMPAMKK